MEERHNSIYPILSLMVMLRMVIAFKENTFNEISMLNKYCIPILDILYGIPILKTCNYLLIFST